MILDLFASFVKVTLQTVSLSLSPFLSLSLVKMDKRGEFIRRRNNNAAIASPSAIIPTFSSQWKFASNASDAVYNRRNPDGKTIGQLAPSPGRAGKRGANGKPEESANIRRPVRDAL